MQLKFNLFSLSFRIVDKIGTGIISGLRKQPLISENLFFSLKFFDEVTSLFHCIYIYIYINKYVNVFRIGIQVISVLLNMDFLCKEVCNKMMLEIGFISTARYSSYSSSWQLFLVTLMHIKRILFCKMYKQGKSDPEVFPFTELYSIWIC